MTPRKGVNPGMCLLSSSPFPSPGTLGHAGRGSMSPLKWGCLGRKGGSWWAAEGPGSRVLLGDPTVSDRQKPRHHGTQGREGWGWA